MSEITDIATLEIKPEQAPALYVPNGLDTYLDHIRQMAKEAPDVTTAKGRDRIGSLARQVGSSKTAIEKPGRDYLRRLKEAVKPAEEELRRFTRECDAIRDAILAPREEWESEQERLKILALHTEALEMNEAFDKAASEKLAAQIESDHEIALLLNEKFDRDAAERAAEAERERIAHEEELKRQAAEQARIDAEQQVQRERQQHQDALSEINGIQQQVIIAQSGRLGVRKGGTVQCIKDTLTETENWPIDDRFGSLKGAAERAKQQAIEQIKQMLITAETIEKQQEALATAERNKREAEEKEAARLAEEKRIADEAAARAANEAHRKLIGTVVVKSLMEHAGLTREQAISTLSAIKDNLIPHTSITY